MSFCGQCGAPLGRPCAACGFDNPPGFKFCGQCGSALVRETGASTPAEDRQQAEHRQLTVLFCDLVGSTTLAERLDPEELRDVVRQYQAACVRVIEQYGGYVAQYLGDGLLVYFGYPQAYEDNARRGVHAGLGILAAIAELAGRLREERGQELAVRLGLSTGPVVTGEVGAGEKRERLALGQTPNIAARLQALAEPGTLVIASSTYRLVEGFFTCESLGARELKGLSHPIEAYRVLGETGVRSRMELAVESRRSPLVGRREELARLAESFQCTRAGSLTTVLITGEAGIGKSRLIHRFRESLGDGVPVWIGYGSPYFQDSAFYAVIDLLQRELGLRSADAAEDRIGRLADAAGPEAPPEAVPLLANLLSIPLPEDAYPPLALTPQRLRDKTLESLASILLSPAREGPAVLVLEDMHWVDPSTEELLARLRALAPGARLLVLLTSRPGAGEIESDPELVRISLERMTSEEITTLVGGLTGGRSLPPRVLAEVIEKTDGVPLFVEELVRTILDTGLVRAEPGSSELSLSLPDLAIPTSLQDSLTARLDRLSSVKEIVQIGSSLGREVDYGLLREITGLADAELQSSLERIVKAGILDRRDTPAQSGYLFRHALIQDAAYRSMLKSTRAMVHQRIALTLEVRLHKGEAVQPELLAHHYTEAGAARSATGYWLQAGQQAMARSAHVEAIRQLGKGLAQVRLLPPGADRDQMEFSFEVTRGPALCATRGYAVPEVEAAYVRAQELCKLMGNSAQLLSIHGLWVFFLVRAELSRAGELAEQMMALAAENPEDLVVQLEAHFALGVVQMYRGELAAARNNLEKCSSLWPAGRPYTFPTGEELCVLNAWLALTFWHLGYPDQALALDEAAISSAREKSHLLSLVYLLLFTTWIRQLRGEPEAVAVLAREVVALSAEHGFFWQSLGQLHQGWASIESSASPAEGLALMRQGFDGYRAPGNRLTQTYYLAMLARAHLVHDPEQAGRFLDEAFAVMEETDERLWESELHRLLGELLLGTGGGRTASQEEAEVCFERALAIARRQGAQSLELRAAMSLGRLWKEHGRCAAAKDLVAGVYGRFTEGFTTPDLQQARALLESMAG